MQKVLMNGLAVPLAFLIGVISLQMPCISTANAGPLDMWVIAHSVEIAKAAAKAREDLLKKKAALQAKLAKKKAAYIKLIDDAATGSQTALNKMKELRAEMVEIQKQINELG